MEMFKTIQQMKEYIMTYNNDSYNGESTKYISTFKFNYENILQKINQLGDLNDNQKLTKSVSILVQWLRITKRNSRCPLCGKLFPNNNKPKRLKFRAHITAVHLRPKKYTKSDPVPEIDRTCPTCQKVLSSPSGLKHHIDYCQNKIKKYKCSKCQTSYSQKQQRDVHMNAFHTHKKIYPCVECDRIFYSSHARCSHMITEHKNEKTFQCSLCKKTFLRYCNLKSHENTHSTESNFECTECPKKFKTRPSLTRHLETHKPESEREKYECPICLNKYASKSSLRTHLSVHTHERPYKCKFCEDSFRLVGHLNAHYKKHTKEKHFECLLQCGRWFAFSHHRDNHMKTHTTTTITSDTTKYFQTSKTICTVVDEKLDLPLHEDQIQIQSNLSQLSENA